MEDGQIVALYFRRDQRAVTETARKYGNFPGNPHTRPTIASLIQQTIL